MSSSDEIRKVRIKKLELLAEAGMDPYPARAKRELSLKEAVNSFSTLEKEKREKWLSGRIMSIRIQGAIIFITLFDGTGSFQILLKKDALGEKILSFLKRPRILEILSRHAEPSLLPRERRKLWKGENGECSPRVFCPFRKNGMVLPI